MALTNPITTQLKHISRGILHFKYAEVKMKGKLEVKYRSCLLVKDVEARNKVLKSVHEGAGETIQSKSIGGHVGRDKTWWMPICGGEE